MIANKSLHEEIARREEAGRQWRENQRRIDDEWRNEQRRIDLEWRQAQDAALVAREDLRTQEAKSQHRSTIIVTGIVATTILAVAAILSAFIQRGTIGPGPQPPPAVTYVIPIPTVIVVVPAPGVPNG